MCLPVRDQSMMNWLKKQLRMLEAWGDEISTRPETETNTILQLERHCSWLRAELARLEDIRFAQAA